MSAVDTLPAPIAGDGNAPLPQRYEAARMAIAECERIDECKDWSNKAAAMAAYARQAKDDSLRVMAVRIQHRAERRLGELLKLIPRADEATRYGREGDHPPVTRTRAATDAGLSEHQRKTALRIAAVPEAEFDAHVESDRPPSITQLANLGKEPGHAVKPQSPWRDIESPEAREACETLERFVQFCERNEPTTISHAVSATEAERLRSYLETAARWLDGLAVDLAQEW
jgi:hypothetical protein